jgi:carbamoyl-phosphate synthase large subunit
VPNRCDSTYLSTIQRLCSKHNVDLIYPLSTSDQDFFSDPEVQRKLQGVKVVVSSAESVRVSNRKVNLFRHLQSAQELLGNYTIVQNLGEAVAALNVTLKSYGAALLKSDVGTGTQGMLCIGHPLSDSAPATGRTWIPTAVFELACKNPYAEWVPLLFKDLFFSAASSWPRLVMAYLPGEEFSVDVLASNGETLACVVRKRMRAAQGMATESVVVSAPDVEEAARSVIAATRLSYVNNVQFRRDVGGIPRLLEINPRIPGTIHLTVAAGLNLPLAACVQALGQAIKLPSPTMGLTALRFAGCVITDQIIKEHT